jgi:hypothetical protein
MLDGWPMIPATGDLHLANPAAICSTLIGSKNLR